MRLLDYRYIKVMKFLKHAIQTQSLELIHEFKGLIFSYYWRPSSEDVYLEAQTCNDKDYLSTLFGICKLNKNGDFQILYDFPHNNQIVNEFLEYMYKHCK